MTQASFQERIQRIEKRTRAVNGKRRRRFPFRGVLTLVWIGFLGLSYGVWSSSDIGSEVVSAALQGHQSRGESEATPKPVPVEKRSSGGAKWVSAKTRSADRQFLSVSTKSFPKRTHSGSDRFVDFIQLQMDRTEISRNAEKGRLGFEGLREKSRRMRDEFWQR